MVQTISALAGVLLLAGCGGDSPQTQGPEDGETDAVTLGVIPIVDVAPVYLGVEQGYFSGEGIDLTLESGQGGAAIVPGVVSGQFQFGFSNNTSLILARSQAIPLKIVAPGNPEAVREIIGTYTEIDPEIAEQLVLPKWSSELNEDTLTLLADLAQEDGLVTEPVDVQELLP